MLKIIENNSTIEIGSKGGNSVENKINESGPRFWIERSRKKLVDRRARIQKEDNQKITKNKTIMDYALEHAKQKVKFKENASNINMLDFGKIDASMRNCWNEWTQHFCLW